MKIKLILGAVLSLFVGVSGFAVNFDSDVPAAIKKQALEDFDFINSVKGEGQSTLHQKIFGKVDGAQYTKFFNDRIFDIGLDGCGNGNAVACVIPFFSDNKMWLTKNFIKFSHPQIARLMVMFHESRHSESENGNWSHAECPTPFLDQDGKEMKSIWTGASLAGEPACDETAYGSYGSSVVMLKNIQKYCQNCTDKVKMDAGIYGDDQFKRVIDQDAIKEMKKDLYDN